MGRQSWISPEAAINRRPTSRIKSGVEETQAPNVSRAIGCKIWLCVRNEYLAFFRDAASSDMHAWLGKCACHCNVPSHTIAAKSAHPVACHRHLPTLSALYRLVAGWSNRPIIIIIIIIVVVVIITPLSDSEIAEPRNERWCHLNWFTYTCLCGGHNWSVRMVS